MAVVGANLTGQPLNWQLVERKAKLLETTRTGPGYRLYALADNSPAKPGLVFDDTGPGAIEVEVWEMEEGVFGSFVALIPAPLAIGTLTSPTDVRSKAFSARHTRHLGLKTSPCSAAGGLGSAADTAKEVPTEDQSYPNPGRFGHLGNLRMLILMLKIAALRPSLPMESANSHSAMQSYHSAYATS